MKRLPIIMLAAAHLLLAARISTGGAAKLPPQATLVREVLVPVPREIFQTLDRFANSNWRAVQHPELARWRAHSIPARNALLLGAVIAEGFIAVEAQDAGETKDLGRAVLTLARSVGVEKAALPRSRSIVEHAQSGDWSAVREEWDRVLPDVQQGMNELQSEELASLVSLGGWLRGLGALSDLLLQNYTAAQAQLLRQPAMLEHFEKELATLSSEVKTDPVVVRMEAGVRKVRALLASREGQVPQTHVRELSGLSAELLKSLSR